MTDEKSCDTCAHQVGWANPKPECELLDDMDCILNGHLYWKPRIAEVGKPYDGTLLRPDNWPTKRVS